MKCTCGHDGVYSHVVDGKALTLCPPCHAIMVYIVRNPSGMPVKNAMSLADLESESLFDVYAKEPPGPTVVADVPVVVSPPTIEEKVSADGPFVPPLRPDHNLRVRVPPEISSE